MHNIIYLLLVSFGALLILGIFHFTIYLQQHDKAFRNYALYLLVMAGFNVVRLLDHRLTGIYPLSEYTVATLDPILSNIALLMYVNFLGVVLNITKKERLFYNCWNALHLFVIASISLYFILRVVGDPVGLSIPVITVASFCCMGIGLLMAIRLLRLRREIFYQLIIAGTVLSVSGVITGLAVNVFVYKDNLAFGGLYFLEISMMVEAVFLSAALGYRLKLAYREKERFQQNLLEETEKRETLALQAARLLQKELDIKKMQNRISRDLHDDVGSSLSSLQIYSSLAVQLIDKKPEEAKELLLQIAANTEEVMDNMGHIVWAMQPREKDSHTMETRLKSIGHNLLTIKNIACTYEIDKAAEAVCSAPEVRKNLALIAKEAINNIAKYSGATQVAVSFIRVNNGIVLSVIDNGAGFDAGCEPTGNGLVNMKARAKAVGGHTQIQAMAGKGTSIICTIPLANISDTGSL